MRFCTETLGCKVNQFETQALETLLQERGHTLSAAGEGCAAVIINTCAVTAESGRKSRQTVRRLMKLEPEAVIAVCGCFSQVSPEDAAALGADLVYGSGDRQVFLEKLEALCQEKAAGATADHGPVRVVDDALHRHDFEELPAGSGAGRTRAMLKIQDGCQNFCTYCIIPYARGPVRSLPLQRAAAEARRLCAEGFGEIVITGIEISSYGRDLEDGTTLLDAVTAISGAAPGVRLRLGSLEPRTITEHFCRGLVALPTICPHFHLSLQSGSDAILRRMKRRYSTVDFYGAVCLLKQYFPGCGITADLIVGFPEETEEEFLETLAFIKTCAFSSMHVFPYSKREGTPAAAMGGQVARAVKQERAKRAAAVAKDMARVFAKSCVGQTLEVLFEREENGISYGHAGNYQEACVQATDLHNLIKKVYINDEKSGILYGEIV